MGKINNMATNEACTELSERIKNLKNGLDVTYRDLNIRLGRPCNTSTLQIRAAHPGKGCSIKLLNNINGAITTFENNSNEAIEELQILKKLRGAAIEDITRVFDAHINKIEEFFSKK